MTTHVQPIGTPPDPLGSPTAFDGRHSIGIGLDKHSDSGDSPWSAPKCAMIGTLGAALITAAVSIFSAMGADGNSDGKTTVTPTPIQESALGSLEEVTVNSSGSEVAVTGYAAENVESVVVMIGPRQSGGQYWAARTEVFNQEWKLVVATDPHLPRPYEIKTQYQKRPSGQTVSGYSFQTPAPTPTPPPPGQVVDCAVVHGDSCFQGPDWGPPSVYRSDQ